MFKFIHRFKLNAMSCITMEQIVALCKRRGIIYPSSQIYGGLQGMYDYGPIGVEIKKNLQNTWWQDMVHMRQDIHGLDSSILTHHKTLYYSGHTETFNDMMTDCKSCKNRWRSDHEKEGLCPKCKSKDITESRAFNLMFKTQMGPVVDENNIAYLRPETAQGIFTNFKNICDSQGSKLPFGVAQIGKAFRNEITPRNFIFRVREFEQMEIEFFVDPENDEKWHQYWIEERYRWWIKQGLSSSKLKQENIAKEELSHYSKKTVDLIYTFAHGDEELEGIANRTDYDLASHSKEQSSLPISAKVKQNSDSTAKLVVQDINTKKWKVPYTIEPSCGVDRGVLAILTQAYTEEKLANDQIRTVLKIQPHLSAIKAAVIPLAKNKPELIKCAQQVQQQLQMNLPGNTVLENSGNIGKNYRRHDEIGTPCCITIDFETIESKPGASNKQSVTVRDRDTLKQERVAIEDLSNYLKEKYFHYQFLPSKGPSDG